MDQVYLSEMRSLGGLVRIPRWPGENDYMGSRKVGEGGSEGLDTREVKDTLADTGWSLSFSFRSPGSSTGPKRQQRNIRKAGPF